MNTKPLFEKAFEKAAISMPFYEAVMYLEVVSNCAYLTCLDWAYGLAYQYPKSKLGETCVLRQRKHERRESYRGYQSAE